MNKKPLEKDNDDDVNCYITKEPIQHEMKLKCGHSFEYIAIFKHLMKTQKNATIHICPYCRSDYPLFIPYNEEIQNFKPYNRSRALLFKNNYLSCSYRFVHGKRKGLCCNNHAHFFKSGIYCFQHEKQLSKKLNLAKDIHYCTQTLKNGNPCKYKVFDTDSQLCKRHYNLKNKELKKTTQPIYI